MTLHSYCWRSLWSRQLSSIIYSFLRRLLSTRLVGAVVAFLFFFFQAEDGIRDWSVTGVQTCALPIYRSRPERDVFDRLYEHAPLLRPARDFVFPKQVTGQTIHFAEVPVLVHSLRIDVVRRYMIGTRHDQAAELSLFSRHAMQRLDVRCDCHEGN